MIITTGKVKIGVIEFPQDDYMSLERKVPEKPSLKDDTT